MGWERQEAEAQLLTTPLELSINKCNGFVTSLLPHIPQYEAAACTLNIPSLQAEMGSQSRNGMPNDLTRYPKSSEGP